MHLVPRPRPSLSGRLGLGLIATLRCSRAPSWLPRPLRSGARVLKGLRGQLQGRTLRYQEHGAGGELSEPSRAESETQGFRTPGGYVPFGITAFRMQTEKIPKPPPDRRR